MTFRKARKDKSCSRAAKLSEREGQWTLVHAFDCVMLFAGNKKR